MTRGKENKVTWSDRLLNTIILPLFPSAVQPNHITLARFLLTPFVLYFLYTNQWAWGVGLFAFTAFTDALDGALARTRNLITEWGKIYDPVADKLLIGLTALVIIPKFFDFILVFLIILSEVIIIIGAYWIKQNYPERELSANGWGKMKMIIQSSALFVLIIASLIALPEPVISVVGIALYFSVGLAVISFIYAGI